MSRASDGTYAYDSSGGSATSGNGRYVAFHSYASNLVAGDTNDTRGQRRHPGQRAEHP